MKKIPLVILCLAFFLLTSCGGSGSSSTVTDSSTDGSGSSNDVPVSTTDSNNTTSGATFKEVLPIFKDNCENCHSFLNTYSQVSFFASSSISRIKSGNMPQGKAKLSNSDIATIESWIAAGKPNN